MDFVGEERAGLLIYCEFGIDVSENPGIQLLFLWMGIVNMGNPDFGFLQLLENFYASFNNNSLLGLEYYGHWSQWFITNIGENHR